MIYYNFNEGINIFKASRVIDKVASNRHH